MESINHSENVFIYNSPVGKFCIRFDYKVHKWALWMSDDIYGHYASPVAAADDVYCQVTGCYEWDSFDTEPILTDVPTDIHNWEIISPK